MIGHRQVDEVAATSRRPFGRTDESVRPEAHQAANSTAPIANTINTAEKAVWGPAYLKERRPIAMISSVRSETTNVEDDHRQQVRSPPAADFH